MSESAPFVVSFETTRGSFEVTVHPEWAPLGAERVRELVNDGFFEGARFFRVISGFMVQFGLSGDPERDEKWRGQPLEDDPVTQSNQRGRLTFATAGPNSRTTQLFINFADNAALDQQGFSPVGEVTKGMEEVVDQLYAQYGEGHPQGRGPSQMKIRMEGNAYLEANFPELDHIKSARIQA